MKNIKEEKEEIKNRHQKRIIPDGELKCVWMTAGQISYKLCNYEFNCEFCPFNEAFGNRNELSRLGDEMPDYDGNLHEIDFLQEMMKSGKGIAGKEIDERKLLKDLFLFKIRRDLFYSK